MSSYASIASKPLPPPSAGGGGGGDSGSPKMSVKEEVAGWLEAMNGVKTPTDQMARILEILRREMEAAPGTGGGGGGGFRNGVGGQQQTRSFGGGGQGGQQPPSHWRGGGGGRFASLNSQSSSGSGSSSPAFDSRNAGMHRSSSGASFHAQDSPKTPSSNTGTPVGRYQSRFKSTGNLEDKILNTVIGNKLNAFTQLTYSDTRDFIYQIIDSGETEFIRDFVEKVFAKATLEDLYCGLFAKLVAEIAHRYPVMYEEMNKYHMEFLKVFENVREDSDAEYALVVKEKQYRMGYGQFMAELAGQNALEKKQLLAMVSKVVEKIWELSATEGKTKTVEEFIDCLSRLLKGLRDRCLSFYTNAKGDLQGLLNEKVVQLVEKRAGNRPSLSSKARYGLMDIRDLVN